MSMRSIALATTALFVLTAGVGVTQAHPQDEQVRQLNLEQLRIAQAARGVTTEPSTMPATETTTPDGQGGPEYQGPPSPEEGMTDDDNTSTPADEMPNQPVPNAPPPARPQ